MVARSRRGPLLLVAAVLACAGFSVTPLLAHPAASGTGDSAGSSLRVSIASDALGLAAGAAREPAAASTPVDLEVTLLPSNDSSLVRLDTALVDPASPLYHHFLTEAQYEARFRPAPSETRSVEEYFAGYGGTAVAVTPDGLGLRERITVAGAEAALGVHYVLLGGGTDPVGAEALGTPTLPASIAPEVVGIGGLTDLGRGSLRPMLRTVERGAAPADARPGEIVQNLSTGAWWFTGSDYVEAYQEPSLFPGSSAVANATYANDSAVATLLMSGFNASNGQNLPPFDPVAVADYFNDTFPSNWARPNVSAVPLDIGGVAPPLPGPGGVENDTTGNVEENSIDLEMAGSFAPGATLVNFYFAASLYENSPSTAAGIQDTADDFATELSTALSYSYGSARLTAVTNSYGLPDLNDSLWDTELAHAAAIGVTVVAASGDQGNAPNQLSGRFQGPDPTWPASAAMNSSGTVAVGGLTVNVSGTATGYFSSNGTLNDSYDPTVGSFTELRAWYVDYPGVNLSGSEGGVSVVYPEPAWQRDSAAQPTIVNVTLAQEGPDGSLGRSEPDVSFPANNTIAYVGTIGPTVLFDVFQGTSIASPIFAGMLAEDAAVAGHPFGFVDPELYRIASYFAAHPSLSDPFVDVTSGGNYLFQAGPGWDGVTGWGTMYPALFLAADANQSIAGYTYTGPSPGLPPPPPPSGNAALNRTLEIVIFVVVVGVAVGVLALLFVGESRGPDARSGPPPGIYSPTPGGPPPPYGARGPPQGAPPATFLCPYCVSIRPAEPVRCPACGAL